MRRASSCNGTSTGSRDERAASRHPRGRKDEPLRAAGVEFIDENGGGPGVRLRKSGKEKPRK